MKSGRPDMRKPDARRLKAERRGRISEYLAALHLMLKGYRIVALRYRTRVGEIDIVARKGDLAAFIEVKARRFEGDALDAVGYSAQKRIRAASDIWLSRQADAARISLRYDIVTVVPGRWPKHYRDAF